MSTSWDRRRSELLAKRDLLSSARVQAVTSTSEFGWNPVTTIWQPSSDIFQEYNTYQLAQAHRISSLVAACIDEKATSAGVARLTVGVDKGADGFEEHDHDALDLFYNNPQFSYDDIIELYVQRMDLTGAGFCLYEKNSVLPGVGVLIPMPTHFVKPIVKGPSVVGYRIGYGESKDYEVGPEEVVGVMYRDPARMYGWHSPLYSAIREFQIDNERENVSMEVMINKNIPAGFIHFGKNSKTQSIPDHQRETLVTSLATASGGVTGARGRNAFLPHGLEWTKGQDVSDIDFKELNGLTESRICMAFQVPPQLVGAKVGIETSTYANYEEARESFYQETMIPLWDKMAAAFTMSIPLGHPDLEFRFDLSGVPELQEDITQKADKVTLLFEKKIVTKNEARQMLKMEPVDGGDEFASTPAPPPMIPQNTLPKPEEAAEEEETDEPEGKSFYGEYHACGPHCNHELHGKDAAAIGSFPKSGPLEKALVAYFNRQEKAIRAKVATKGEEFEFDQEFWTEQLIKDTGPIFHEIYSTEQKSLINRSMQHMESKSLRGVLKAKADEFPTGYSVGQSFEVIQPQTLELIDSQIHDYAASVNLTTGKNLGKAIGDVVKAAKLTNTIPDLAKAVQGVFLNAKDSRARMIAITESSRAVHDAQVLAADTTGIVSGFKWVLSGDACPICQYYDSEGKATGVPVVTYTSLGDAKSTLGSYKSDMPPLHPNCVIGETTVIAPGKRAGFVAPYDGPVVKIRTANAGWLTVTPNHMLLTDRGFARASQLRKGDYVIKSSIFERVVSRYPNNDNGPSLIKDVVRSLSKSSRCSTMSVPVSPEYLHGDAAFCKGKIDVVATDSLLRNHFESVPSEVIPSLELDRADVGMGYLSGCSDFASVLFALRDATGGPVSGDRKPSAFLNRQALHTQLVSSRPATQGNTSPLQAADNQWATYAQALAECQNALATEIEFDQVLDVDVSSFIGHVYDLQTESGLYIANGIVSSNCRCTQQEVFFDEPIPERQKNIPEGWTSTPRPGV